MLSLRDIFLHSTLITILFILIHFTAVAMTATIKSTTVMPPVRPSRPRTDVNKSGEYIEDYKSSIDEVFTVNSDCPNCELQEANLQRSLTPDKIKALRLEIIKDQILSKLKMKQRPINTLPRNMLPAPLSDGELLTDVDLTISGSYNKKDNMNLDDFYGTTTQVIVFSEQGSARCFPNKKQSPSSCFRFQITNELANKEMTAVQLWVYKLANSKDAHNQTFVINELAGPNRSKSKSKIMATIETFLKTGWIKFDVRNLVSKWMKKTNNTYMIEITCKTCSTHSGIPVSTQSNQRPFLVINTAEIPLNIRQKRSLDCAHSSIECCREPFYVSFADIGWNDWIIQPLGYNANYCRGSCRGVTNPMFHHTSIMQRVVLIEQDPDRRLALSPCCSPTRMSDISLIYFNENMQIFKKNLPNMVVESCGCS